ncbi:MAG: zinc-ribbon domain-containing protein [Hyphomicrobiales bacterium]
MKIACPNCSTKYTLKEQALGTSGRKMKCAKCEHIWLALPPKEIIPEMASAESEDFEQVPNTDQVSESLDEAEWDKDLASEINEDAEAAAAKNTKMQPVSHYETSGEAKEKRSPRYIAKKAVAFVKDSVNAVWAALLWLKGLNLKEQIAVAIGLLMPLVLVGGVYTSRERLVHQFPDLASLYESVGIGVNLQGLAFEDIRTIRRPENGVAVLVVEGAIRNITEETQKIPQLHFILSGRNREVYSWQDKANDEQLPSGERVEFRTVLASPPDVADRLHVRFFSKNAHLNRL